MYASIASLKLLHRDENQFSNFRVLHDVEQLVALFMHASARRLCILFQNTRAKNEDVNFDVCKNRPKLIGYHTNVPWITNCPLSERGHGHVTSFNFGK